MMWISIRCAVCFGFPSILSLLLSFYLLKENSCLIQRWRLQAEANDEAERLLSSQPVPTEQV
jgi:hypothetical protein